MKKEVDKKKEICIDCIHEVMCKWRCENPNTCTMYKKDTPPATKGEGDTETEVVDSDDDDLCRACVRCLSCDYDFLDGYTYCPNCGRKVTKKYPCCNEETDDGEGWFHRCMLPAEHEGKHKSQWEDYKW